MQIQPVWPIHLSLSTDLRALRTRGFTGRSLQRAATAAAAPARPLPCPAPQPPLTLGLTFSRDLGEKRGWADGQSEWVAVEWGYCDFYLPGLLQAVRAWQGSAGFWPWLLLQPDRCGPREGAAGPGCGKLFYGSFILAKHSLPSKAGAKGKNRAVFVCRSLTRLGLHTV